jgi:hypothetical protein
MYIIAIAWIYVTLLMAATEASITACVLTFIFYGAMPCAILLWLMGTPQRRRDMQKKLLEEELSSADGSDTKPNE